MTSASGAVDGRVAVCFQQASQVAVGKNPSQPAGFIRDHDRPGPAARTALPDERLAQRLCSRGPRGIRASGRITSSTRASFRPRFPPG